MKRSWKFFLALIGSLLIIDVMFSMVGLPYPLRLAFSFGYGWFFEDLLNLLGIDFDKNEDGE